MKMRATRSGIHLFDRRTGINLLVDEVSPPSNQWAIAPRHVSFALTNACDLSCNYCYAAKNRASLEPATVLRWSRELCDLGCLGVGFGGGEPTLVSDFPGLCISIASETDLAVQFTTHGHHLSPAMCDKLAGHVSFIRVSMDGVGITYERLRSRSFPQLLKMIRRIQSITPFGINCVVNFDTIGELDDVRRYAIDSGASELLLLPEVSSTGQCQLDSATLSRLSHWINANHRDIRVCVSEHNIPDGVPVATPFPLDEPLDSYAFVDASGVLKRSSTATNGVELSRTSIRQAMSTLRKISESEALQ